MCPTRMPRHSVCGCRRPPAGPVCSGTERETVTLEITTRHTVRGDHPVFRRIKYPVYLLLLVRSCLLSFCSLPCSFFHFCKRSYSMVLSRCLLNVFFCVCRPKGCVPFTCSEDFRVERQVRPPQFNDRLFSFFVTLHWAGFVSLL